MDPVPRLSSAGFLTLDEFCLSLVEKVWGLFDVCFLYLGMPHSMPCGRLIVFLSRPVWLIGFAPASSRNLNPLLVVGFENRHAKRAVCSSISGQRLLEVHSACAVLLEICTAFSLLPIELFGWFHPWRRRIGESICRANATIFSQRVSFVLVPLLPDTFTRMTQSRTRYRREMPFVIEYVRLQRNICLYTYKYIPILLI